MKSSSILIGMAMTGAVLVLPSCGDKDYPIEHVTIVEDGVGPLQHAESNLPTALLGKGGSLSGKLSGIFTNQVEAGKAKHVVVACSDLDAYAEELELAYQRGIVITVVDPDPAVLSSWCASKGMVYPGMPALSESALNENLLISFNRKAASISVQKRADNDDVVIEDEGPLVIFTDWLDDLFTANLKGPDFRSRDIRKRFAPQMVTHVFPIDIPTEATATGGWCVPAGASLSTTASLKCEIYPMHSFADNVSLSGDLYAVEAELTIHNGGVYNGCWQYAKGLNQYETRGFFLSNCDFNIDLLKLTSSGVAECNGVFAAGPVPESTFGSTSYEKGFTWVFDGWLTGGNGLESSTPTPIQNGGWIWDNTSGSTDCGFEVQTDIHGDAAIWSISIDGMPQLSGSSVSFPEISKGDLSFRSSWIWAVGEAKDDTTEFYYMRVELDPTYRWYRRLLPAGDLQPMQIEMNNIPPACFLLIPPSRAEGQRL